MNAFWLTVLVVIGTNLVLFIILKGRLQVLIVIGVTVGIWFVYFVITTGFWQPVLVTLGTIGFFYFCFFVATEWLPMIMSRRRRRKT